MTRCELCGRLHPVRRFEGVDVCARCCYVLGVEPPAGLVLPPTKPSLAPAEPDRVVWGWRGSGDAE